MEQTIAVPTPDGPMQTFVALPDDRPAGERLPALVVIQEAFGVNSHIKNVCRRIASHGYAAFAPELFHRLGDGVDLPYDDFSKVMPAFVTLTNDGLLADVQASLAAARADAHVDPDRVGIIGFCVGGFAAFLSTVIVELAGKRALAQQGGKSVQQALVSGVSRYLGFHQIRSRSLRLAGPAGVARL